MNIFVLESQDVHEGHDIDVLEVEPTSDGEPKTNSQGELIISCSGWQLAHGIS